MGERAMRTGRLARTAGPAWLVSKTAARWAGSRVAFGRQRRAKHERFVLRTAEDVTKTMGEMKGAAMKVGQVLSLMTGMVPDEMAGQLATLQASAPPMAYRLVEKVFRDEYGMPPGKLFRSFEHEPFAAASIGQVHRATLNDGTPVAVKVQYPGVREAIEHDLANMGLMIGMAGMLAKGLDAGPIVNDLKEGIRGELDYRREAGYQERFGEIYAANPFVRVPRVYAGLSTGRVLVQEYIEGRPFREALDLPQMERNRVAEIVFRFAFGNFYRNRLFNGDPHPGNYLLCADGQVAFLDYGCIAEFDDGAINGFKRLLRSLYASDLPAWREATEAIGLLKRDAPFETERLWEHMKWFWAPVLEDEVTFTRELAGEMVRRNTQTGGPGGEINRYLNIPPGMVFLSRINFGLAGLLAAIEARGPWRGIIAEFIDDAPACTEIGRRWAR